MSVDSSLWVENCFKLCEIWGTGKFFSETFWEAFTMSMLLAVLLVLYSDAEQLTCLFAILVTGFNFLGFGIGLGGKVVCTFFVRSSGEMATCSVEFLSLFESEEIVFLGISTGLLLILLVAVAAVVVVVVSVVVLVE